MSFWLRLEKNKKIILIGPYLPMLEVLATPLAHPPPPFPLWKKWRKWVRHKCECMMVQISLYDNIDPLGSIRGLFWQIWMDLLLNLKFFPYRKPVINPFFHQCAFGARFTFMAIKNLLSARFWWSQVLNIQLWVVLDMWTNFRGMVWAHRTPTRRTVMEYQNGFCLKNLRLRG